MFYPPGQPYRRLRSDSGRQTESPEEPTSSSTVRRWSTEVPEPERSTGGVGGRGGCYLKDGAHHVLKLQWRKMSASSFILVIGMSLKQQSWSPASRVPSVCGHLVRQVKVRTWADGCGLVFRVDDMKMQSRSSSQPLRYDLHPISPTCRLSVRCRCWSGFLRLRSGCRWAAVGDTPPHSSPPNSQHPLLPLRPNGSEGTLHLWRRMSEGQSWLQQLS